MKTMMTGQITWTGEARREDALMIFPYEPQKVDQAGAYFDGMVARIQTRDFTVRRLPERKVCAECDFRMYCQRQGVLSGFAPVGVGNA